MRRSKKLRNKTADLIAIVMKQPRTVAELSDVLGTRDRTGVSMWLAAFRAEGIVFVSGFRRSSNGGRAAAVFAWQSQPFECADVTYAQWRRQLDAAPRDEVVAV